MDDNSISPKHKIEVRDYILDVIKLIIDNNQTKKIKDLSKILISNNTEIPNDLSSIEDVKEDVKNNISNIFWKSIIRNMLVNGLVEKKIEDYGVVKLTEKGNYLIKYLKNEYKNYEKVMSL